MSDEPQGPIHLTVSVGDLVAFTCRGGDLYFRQFGGSSAREGVEGHQWVQKSRPEGYQSEVTIRHIHQCDGFQLEIRGRIDGVYTHTQPITIEEIKTTRMDIADIAQTTRERHMAQARLYAAFYAAQNQQDHLTVRLTYLDLKDNTEHHIEEEHTSQQLWDFYQRLVTVYLEWAVQLYRARCQRNEAVNTLGFPFGDFRPGQRQLAASVYRGIQGGRIHFVQAPTGIGKTMGVLFPAVKALPTYDKLFFLTAKTPGRHVAQKAFAAMAVDGLKTLTLTARDKMCFNAPCDPTACEYARGYYDRLRPAMFAAFQHNNLTPETIRQIAREHTVCPFEFTHDLSPYVDAVICDYNYVFDPVVQLKRFFSESRADHVLLVDEAHNLVDRARDMYSADLDQYEINPLIKAMKDITPTVVKTMRAINRQLISLRKTMEEADQHEKQDPELPKKLIGAMQRFSGATETWIGEEGEPTAEFLEFYFSVWRFLRAAETYDERYTTLYRRTRRNLNVKLYNLDPSALLAKTLKSFRAVTFFSATLTPFNYFVRILGERGETKIIPSPFPPERRAVYLARGISTKYRHRAAGREPIAQLLATLVQGKRGNYLVFFPSYEYMEQIRETFEKAYPETQTIHQHTAMDESARDQFLAAFQENPPETLVGFAVMGGIFAEGVDLVGSRLIGVMVVGVGLPKLCLERDLIRDFFNADGGPGYEFAYQFPGMNKVLQTAGRVIRDETDKGVVCLVDARFDTAGYRTLFPKDWRVQTVDTPTHLAQQLKQFWQEPDSPT